MSDREGGRDKTRGPPSILTINAGSSSLRFSLHRADGDLRRRLSGKIDRIGRTGTRLTVDDPTGPRPPQRLVCADHHHAMRSLLDWLEARPDFASVAAVGHRIVHGMHHCEPQRITPRLLAELRRNAAFAPEHLPREIALIDAIARRRPRLPQIACFDTAFHCTMPRVARLLPIPRRYSARGVERYGFHGLSYAFLMDELARLDPAASRQRVILAHLGNGASLAAVQRGQSIDTSMGFTPTAGLVMGTRTGDLDPGVVDWLVRTERMSAARLMRLLNHESGLLGVSETSSDMRDLLAREARDVRAAEAIALFCQQAKKWIGAFAAALGGLDTLVFAGGIGENSPQVRDRICAGLRFLGVALDRRRNAAGAAVISKRSGRVVVRVIPTDEERMIAKSVVRALRLGSRRRSKP